MTMALSVASSSSSCAMGFGSSRRIVAFIAGRETMSTLRQCCASLSRSGGSLVPPHLHGHGPGPDPGRGRGHGYGYGHGRGPGPGHGHGPARVRIFARPLVASLASSWRCSSLHSYSAPTPTPTPPFSNAPSNKPEDDDTRRSNTNKNTSHGLNLVTNDRGKNHTDTGHSLSSGGWNYDPKSCLQDILRAAAWNQGGGSAGSWDRHFVRSAVDQYERHILYVYDRDFGLAAAHRGDTHYDDDDDDDKDDDRDSGRLSARRQHQQHQRPRDPHNNHGPNTDPDIDQYERRLLSPYVVARAFKALLRTNVDTSTALSSRVRLWERVIGTISRTTLTDALSLRLLEANGKAGNVGRALALLELRQERGYAPTMDEFRWAVRSIVSAGLDLRRPGGRNVYARQGVKATGDIDGLLAHGDGRRGRRSRRRRLRRANDVKRGIGGGISIMEEEDPADIVDPALLDDPTRWLDAILVNMNRRGCNVTLDLANEMLDCYSCTGRTGKAIHFFYSVRAVGNKNKKGRGLNGTDKDQNQNHNQDHNQDEDQDEDEERKKDGRVRMRMRSPPPYHKVPSEAGDNPIRWVYGGAAGGSSGGGTTAVATTTTLKGKRRNEQGANGSRTYGINRNKGIVKEIETDNGQNDNGPREPIRPILEWQTSPSFSKPLSSAFAFARALSMGNACGHRPIKLDVRSYNALLKACTYRGAHRLSLEVLTRTMRTEGMCDPDVVSYNTVLAGLARVGDVRTMSQLLVDMTNDGVGVDAFTVEALVDGYLNVGDVPTSITLVQDLFNQHSALPPYTTHLKILEFALASDMPYEARRHVYFLQQLWKWTPTPPPATTTTTTRAIYGNTSTKKMTIASSVSSKMAAAIFGTTASATRTKKNEKENKNESGNDDDNGDDDDYDNDEEEEVRRAAIKFKKLEYAVGRTSNHPKLSRDALVALFAYFGEKLTDDDFF